MTDVKISEQLKNKSDTYWSLEYFPPRSPQGVLNLFGRIERMGRLGPQFIDITWGAGGSTSEKTVQICEFSHAQGLSTQMHLTCTNMEVDKFKAALLHLRKVGIRNVLALRGDPPKGKEEWSAVEGGFSNARDLVRFIRQEHGDYFSVGVAGYPEGHPDGRSYEEELYYLKEKVDAGADLIVSQLFYDADMFLKWVKDCRRIGITVPILPGIMPIHTYGGFVKMTGFCKTYVPGSVRAALEPIKNDDSKVKEYGIELAVKMCRKLIAGGIPGLHFYTLNLESSVPEILVKLGLVDAESVEKPRSLPWEKQTDRKGEEVRPVFWANRPESYVRRTSDWDSFPNGRWSDSKSPAFAGVEGHGGHSPYVSEKLSRQLLAQWGELSNEEDLNQVFVRYIKGEIGALPWSEGALMTESAKISQPLLLLNANGFLTINSQPRVNGVPSSHPVHGWGSYGGYVYQKAYVEFFCSPEKWKLLKSHIDNRPQITYHAVNKAGESECNVKGVTALTWGSFPGREILQPTVVDPEVFQNYWKDEAFGLWTSRWAEHTTGTTREVLDKAISTYMLVNIVDNDYVSGSIFAVFRDIIGE